MGPSEAYQPSARPLTALRHRATAIRLPQLHVGDDHKTASPATFVGEFVSAPADGAASVVPLVRTVNVVPPRGRGRAWEGAERKDDERSVSDTLRTYSCTRVNGAPTALLFIQGVRTIVYQ